RDLVGDERRGKHSPRFAARGVKPDRCGHDLGEFLISQLTANLPRQLLLCQPDGRNDASLRRHTTLACARAASPSRARGRRRLTGRLNTRAALRPRMLRLAWSLRNGSEAIALGGAEPQ